MIRRIGLLGGTFDPIHAGHLDLARVAQRNLELTSLLLLPSHVPPHRPQPVASPFHRFAMVAIAVAGQPTWQASDLELRHASPSYTATTLRRLHADGYSPQELFFIVGADAFAEIASWKDYPELLNGAHFVVVSRPGHPVGALPGRLPQLARRIHTGPLEFGGLDHTTIILIDQATADVSATAIRARVAHRQSITGMVVPGVEQHIEQHGLYSYEGPGHGCPAPGEGSTAGELHG